MPFPGFEFRYILCTFLQAVPLSSVLYLKYRINLQVLLKINIPPLEEGLLWIVLTCIIGLFVDGVRHELESVFEHIGKTKIWHEMTFGKAAAAAQQQVFVDYALVRTRDWYHLYEFFANFALCAITVIILILFLPQFSFVYCLLGKDFVLISSFILTLVTLYSVYSSYRTNQRHIDWLKNYVKVTEKEANKELPAFLAAVITLVWLFKTLFQPTFWPILAFISSGSAAIFIYFFTKIMYALNKFLSMI